VAVEDVHGRRALAAPLAERRSGAKPSGDARGPGTHGAPPPASPPPARESGWIELRETKAGVGPTLELGLREFAERAVRERRLLGTQTVEGASGTVVRTHRHLVLIEKS